MDAQTILTFLSTQGYVIIFLLMVIEGPITTFTAAFLASQGILDIYLVFLISVLGNSIPDFCLYMLGRFSRKNFFETILKRFKISKEKLNFLEKNLDKHFGKTIITLKLIPGLAIPGLIILGFSKIKYSRVLLYGVLFDIISEGIFVCLGYFSGITLLTFLKMLKLEKYILLTLAISLIIVFLILKKINRKLSKKNEISFL